VSVSVRQYVGPYPEIFRGISFAIVRRNVLLVGSRSSVSLPLAGNKPEQLFWALGTLSFSQGRKFMVSIALCYQQFSLLLFFLFKML